MRVEFEEMKDRFDLRFPVKLRALRNTLVRLQREAHARGETCSLNSLVMDAVEKAYGDLVIDEDHEEHEQADGSVRETLGILTVNFGDDDRELWGHLRTTKKMGKLTGKYMPVSTELKRLAHIGLMVCRSGNATNPERTS